MLDYRDKPMPKIRPKGTPRKKAQAPPRAAAARRAAGKAGADRRALVAGVFALVAAVCGTSAWLLVRRARATQATPVISEVAPRDRMEVPLGRLAPRVLPGKSDIDSFAVVSTDPYIDSKTGMYRVRAGGREIQFDARKIDRVLEEGGNYYFVLTHERLKVRVSPEMLEGMPKSIRYKANYKAAGNDTRSADECSAARKRLMEEVAAKRAGG